MQENDKGNTFTVIDGGKGTRRTGNKATPGGLTEKQEAFAQGLAEGLTNAEAYRRAYQTEGMKENTIWTEACKLAQHPKVDARLNELLAEKRGRNSMEANKRAERNADRVWRGVWRLAENVDQNVPPAVQQSALALAAKMAGMLTDQVKIESVGTDSSTIERELIERLQRLSKSA
jgi:hypothetical protein